MALLSISEPLGSETPISESWVIGIDLGTTHSLVAVCDDRGAHCLKDSDGDDMLLSVVAYEDNQVLVGKEAMHFPNAIISVKRLMGQSWKDKGENHTFPIQKSTLGKIDLLTNQGVKTPEEVSAAILDVLKKRAESFGSREVTGAVIAVPAYFDDAQRQATLMAADKANIQVLRLINEPTAAAVAYGLSNQQSGQIVVYDFGGGTFDVSILRLSEGVFEVLSTCGDTLLGGDDFDDALVKWCCTNWNIENLSADLAQLKKICKQAREQLSHDSITTVIFNNNSAHLTREIFESLIEPLIEKSMRVCRRALRDAKMTVEEIEHVILVGGTTRTPLIRSKIKAFFKREPMNGVDPDRVVALGAAMQASMLAGQGNQVLLLDVVPLSLGLETMGGLMEKIIPRNTTLPTTGTQQFTTHVDGQSGMTIRVFQGERELTDDCRLLSEFTLTGIPPMVAGAAKVKVTFDVNANGILTVTAAEIHSGVQITVSVTPSQDLTPEHIEKVLIESLTHARSDVQIRQLKESVVDAERLILAVASAMDKDADMLTKKEQEDYMLAIDTLKKAIKDNSREFIIQGITQLSLLTEPFAAKRMNQSINQKLAGKNINELEAPDAAH